MKRLINILLLSVMIFRLNAQSTYDVIPLFNPDLTGTARFVGMGGAMSALGGDMSVMSVNPAGIGIYRSNDLAVTASVNTIESKATFLGNSLSKDKTFFSFDNIGLVFSGNYGGDVLKFVNLGINYTRRNNFRKDFAMNGWYADGNGAALYSQQFQMQHLFDNSSVNIGNISSSSYFNSSWPWLPLLAGDAGILDETGEIMYYPTDATYYSEERGGVDQVDMNVSCNIDDRLYLGVTFGMQYIDSKRYSLYGEYDDFGTIYTLENWYKTEGSAFDVKLGAIVRPFVYSPLRIGLAVHLPTYYKLTDYAGAFISGLDNGNGGYFEMDTRWADAYGDDYIVDYNVRSPWRLNVSAGYTFDDFIALNAEYEMVDYSTAKMEYEDGPEMTDMNDEFDSNMKTSHIFRIGAEMKLDDNFSIRCGYNYMSSAFDKSAWKYISPYSASTVTEYANTLDTNIFTVGFGYRGKSIYFDAAYQYSMQKADFYTYVDPEIALPATDVENIRNKFVVTFGVRF